MSAESQPDPAGSTRKCWSKSEGLGTSRDLFLQIQGFSHPVLLPKFCSHIDALRARVVGPRVGTEQRCQGSTDITIILNPQGLHQPMLFCTKTKVETDNWALQSCKMGEFPQSWGYPHLSSIYRFSMKWIPSSWGYPHGAAPLLAGRFPSPRAAPKRWRGWELVGWGKDHLGQCPEKIYSRNNEHVFSNILWMEEILHQLGTIGNCRTL